VEANDAVRGSGGTKELPAGAEQTGDPEGAGLKADEEELCRDMVTQA
jgi:hypothetical protein